MDKILLIEDRIERQNRFIDETSIDLNSLENEQLLDNTIGTKYTDVFNALKDDTFNFQNYSIIISHKSAFEDYNTSFIRKLEQYCQKNNKVLVLFSGGIDANYYLKDEGFELMEVNSKTFYSQNLQLFLEDFKAGNSHPLILCYGDKWKLNILLNILEKLNLYIATYTSEKAALYSAFMRDNPDISLLETLDIKLYIPKIEDRKIQLQEIKMLKNSITNFINESLIYE